MQKSEFIGTFFLIYSTAGLDHFIDEYLSNCQLFYTLIWAQELRLRSETRLEPQGDLFKLCAHLNACSPLEVQGGGER